MHQRQYPNTDLIVEQDIFSGNSKVMSDLTSWSLTHAGGSMDSMIVSYCKTPDDILQIISNADNIIISNGEIGTTVNQKTYKIGEYRMIASSEHNFNAVICCFDGSDKYNLNNNHDVAVFNAAFSISLGSIRKISTADVMALPFFASSDNGFITVSFEKQQIAQQVYDSDFWTNCKGETTVSTTPPEWFVAVQSKKATSKEKGGGCYIATAVYGSYDCPQVWTLRRYRDFALAGHWYGTVFIHIYYMVSPLVIKCFGSYEWFNKFWRRKLDKTIDKLKNKGYSSLPYEDRTW